MMELRMYKASHISSLGWQQAYYIVREPSAMTKGLIPEVIEPRIAIGIAAVVFRYEFLYLLSQPL